MFGSAILDIAIGLVFVYCIYSLFATIINEIISSFLGLRGKMLEKAIKRMLMDDDPNSVLSSRLFTAFFQHPVIKYLNENGSRKPSYISPQEFSKALVEGLKTAGSVAGLLSPQAIASSLQALDSGAQSETVKLLRSFLEEANNDMVKFRALVEQWFNDMMDRASGWYKRQAEWISLVIGLAVAIAFNASTFTIASHLMQDKTARQELAQMASSYLQSRSQASAKDSTKAAADSVADSLVIYATNLYKGDISQSNHLLGLGWSSNATANHMDARHWPLNVLGWLVTALAVSLGAPFWFDLLSKLVPLRGTGPKPGEGSTASGNTDVPLTQRKG